MMNRQLYIAMFGMLLAVLRFLYVILRWCSDIRVKMRWSSIENQSPGKSKIRDKQSCHLTQKYWVAKLA
jgi:hypothetical protein